MSKRASVSHWRTNWLFRLLLIEQIEHSLSKMARTFCRISHSEADSAVSRYTKPGILASDGAPSERNGALPRMSAFEEENLARERRGLSANLRFRWPPD